MAVGKHARNPDGCGFALVAVDPVLYASNMSLICHGVTRWTVSPSISIGVCAAD